MSIGKIPSLSLSWVKGTKNPAVFSLKDWDFVNAKTSEDMITIGTREKDNDETQFASTHGQLVFINFAQTIGNGMATCLSDMTKAVIANLKPNQDIESGKKLKYYNEKWPFHYASFYIFGDHFERSDVIYYKNGGNIHFRNKKTWPGTNTIMPGYILLDRSELCHNLAFAVDYKE